MSFLGFLSYETRAVVSVHPPTIRGYEMRVCNAFLGGPAGHGFWLDWLKLACANVLARAESSVSDVTGGLVLERVLAQRRASGIDDVLVLPSAQVWGTPEVESGWMRRRPASYNAEDMSQHWSVLQGERGLYVDD